MLRAGHVNNWDLCPKLVCIQTICRQSFSLALFSVPAHAPMKAAFTNRGRASEPILKKAKY
jgi:hypothetical protein